MTWVGLATPQVQRFSTFGLGCDRCDAPVVGQDIKRGTVVLELAVPDLKRPAIPLRCVSEVEPRKRALHLAVSEDRKVSLVQINGAHYRHIAVQSDPLNGSKNLRISYAWDMGAGVARLAVEQSETFDTRVMFKTIEDPLPMSTSDLRDMVMRFCEVTSGIEYVALSSEIEPIGPLPSLSPYTPIRTPFGYKPAGHLRRGDTVYTSNSEIIPILHVLKQRLPSVGNFQMVRVRAPYYGLQQDIIIGASQRLLLDGSEVEYNHGHEAVLVTAGHLVNGISAVREEAAQIAEYVQLVTPHNEPVIAAGCRVETMNIGRLRRRPAELAHTLFKDVTNGQLPEHARAAFPALDAFEAVTLAEQRVA